MSDLKTTPLTAWHRNHGAKMAPFAGFDMPVQYEGIIAEHGHTRSQASVFDICHMGEFLLSGAGARQGLNAVVTQDLDTLAKGRCRYGFLLNEAGGILDDLIIYCLGEDLYMLVVNGACEEQDFAWIGARLPAGLDFRNVSAETGKIDLQGPASLGVLEGLTGRTWKHLKYFTFEETTHQGHRLLVSRTGYTGELGYELYVPASTAPAMWEALLNDPAVKPAGLGARDTLRLESGLPLYGQDLDTDHTPVESGLGLFLKKAGDFIGKAGLGKDRERLIALTIEGRRSARHHDQVCLADGTVAGHVTSGSFAPTLGCCVALAYVGTAHAQDQDFVVRAARAELPAKRVELPFYRLGTARMKLE